MMAKQCTHCLRINPGDATRCVKCGHPGFVNIDFNPPWLEVSNRERYEGIKYEERVR